MPDIARTSAVFFLPDGTGTTFTGSACPPIVLTFAARASRNTQLSAPEHHRYVRFLDCKVHHEASKTNHDGAISNGKHSFDTKYKYREFVNVSSPMASRPGR